MEENKQVSSQTPGSESKSIIDQAKEAHDNLSKRIEEYKALIAEEAKVKSMELLGGKSTAGQAPAPVVEESPKDYVKRVMSNKLK